MVDRNIFVEKTLLRLLEQKKYMSLRDILTTMNPADIAYVFDQLEEQKLPLVFRLLPKELAAETFVEVRSETSLSVLIPPQRTTITFAPSSKSFLATTKPSPPLFPPPQRQRIFPVGASSTAVFESASPARSINSKAGTPIFSIV